MTPTSEPLGELALVEPRSAHCAVSLALGRSLGRQRDDQAPLRRRRTRYILVMRHSPEDHFVEQILSPGERLVAGFALAPAVRQVAKIDDEAAFFSRDQIHKPGRRIGHPFHASLLS